MPKELSLELETNSVSADQGFTPDVSHLALGRRQICLNGTWKFQPACSNSGIPVEAWGTLDVPGVWYLEKKWPWWNLATPLETKETWSDVDFAHLNAAWFQRTITIPETWVDSEILLGFKRIHTRATVYINGDQIGSVTFPSGELVLPQKYAGKGALILSVHVEAAHDGKPQATVWDAGSYTIVENELLSRGIPEDVYLLSKPRGPRIESIFIRPSFREKTLGIDLTIDNMGLPTQGSLIINVVSTETGHTELQAEVAVQIENELSLEIPWQNPKLWNIGEPNLYLLELSLKGNGIRDHVRERFGFRELWIEGRDFVLNGKKVRFRPTMAPLARTSGNIQAIDRWIACFQSHNYNLIEIWPEDELVVGSLDFKKEWLDRADEAGMPLMFPLPNPKTFLFNSFFLGKPIDESAYSEWETYLKHTWKSIRNHPSAVIWVICANAFAHPDDQNPLRIGNREKLEAYCNYPDKQRMRIGSRILDTVRGIDTTRPTTSHHNAATGDFHTMNHYLGFHPLQEREDWLSAWAESGDLPYMSVEFGIPFAISLGRDRDEYGKARYSECWMTEYAAIYLGAEAYRLESQAYRDWLLTWQNNPGAESFDEPPGVHFEPAFQRICELFVRNTWRSWRSFGLSGGLIPWTEGYSWDYRQVEKIESLPQRTQEGEWGNQACSKDPYDTFGPIESGASLSIAGQALKEGNAPILMWIAGPQSDFTRKDHNYHCHDSVPKSFVLINDSGRTQKYAAEVWVDLGADAPSIHLLKTNGTIETGNEIFIPVVIPPYSLEDDSRAQIIAQVDIDGSVLRDSFEINIIRDPSPADTLEVTIWDPIGDSTALLQEAGFKTIPLGNVLSDDILVIGRGAFDSATPPVDLKAFVERGGHLVILAQKPDTLNRLGLRVAKSVARKFFPLSGSSGRAKVDSRLLRDWRGNGSLVDEIRVTPDDEEFVTYPAYGWHWGNRGSVSSAPLEKPHFSGWRPRVEGEFDLAYTAWMDLAYGKGCISLTTFDLESRTDLDPAIPALLGEILRRPEFDTRAPHVLVSGNTAPWSDQRITSISSVDSITPECLLVVTADSSLTLAQITDHLAVGGKALVIGVPECVHTAGWTTVKPYHIADEISPWKELTGVSLSDIRTRMTVSLPLLSDTFPGLRTAGNLLGRMKSGEGTAVFCLADTSMLEVENNPALRFSRWRWIRLASQIAANMGATFQTDMDFLEAIMQKQKAPAYYHPDYIDTFSNGDDPYRYYRW